MAAPRLKLATQTGEKVARDAGYASFPVPPKKIVEAKGIRLVAKPPDQPGISGALILVGGEVTILHSTEHNEGFANFSIAHELGHFCLPGHPEQIMASNGMHASRAGFRGTDPIELEADHFAAGLLMPGELVRSFFDRRQLGLEAIRELSAEADTSLTAAAIRATECAVGPVAIVVSQGDRVGYAFMSAAFKSYGGLSFLRAGASLPASVTRRLNEGVVREGQSPIEADTDLEAWFDGSSRVALREEVLRLGSYERTLTVLTGDPVPDPDDPEYDDEEALIEAWTPRFRR